MNEQLLVRLCEIVLAAAALLAIIIILAAAWYDMRAIAQKSRLRSIATHLPKTLQPYITILIYARNNASTINTCIERIAVNGYEKYNILIVDNASTDNTVATVGKYIKSHPKVPVTIYSGKKPVDRPVALQEAYKATQKNELILILHATDNVNPTLLKEAVAHFILDNKLSSLILRQFTKFDYRFSTLSTQFIQLTKNILLKARFVHPTTKKHYSDSPLMVRGFHFTSDPPPLRLLTAYASSVLVMRPVYSAINVKTDTFKTIIKNLLFLLFLSMMTYFFYTAATLQSSTMLTLSWLLTVLWLLAITWSDDAMTSGDKLDLTITIPFMYFVFFASLILYTSKPILQRIRTLLVPTLGVGNLLNAIQLELYSTRY